MPRRQAVVALGVDDTAQAGRRIACIRGISDVVGTALRTHAASRFRRGCGCMCVCVCECECVCRQGTPTTPTRGGRIDGSSDIPDRTRARPLPATPQAKDVRTGDHERQQPTVGRTSFTHAVLSLLCLCLARPCDDTLLAASRNPPLSPRPVLYLLYTARTGLYLLTYLSGPHWSTPE
ncbi:hypothetical protein ACJQWK_11809 [Exserohilum turcicum]